jgi:hypothetical protein
MKKSVVILLLLMTACGKDSTHNSITVPDVIQAANKRGNITGTIILYNNDGATVADNSGVTVSIDNNNVSTKTDANGKWVLDSIPYGIYDLTYSKVGYATGKLMGVDHKATNHATTVITHSRALNQISNIEITAIQTSNFDANPQMATAIQSGLFDNGVHIEPVFANANNTTKPIRLFFSDNANVGADNYLAAEKTRFSGNPNEDAKNYNYTLKWFVGKGFKPGQTIYVKAYGEGFANDEYVDAITGLTVFPSLSPKSGTASFVLPLK